MKIFRGIRQLVTCAGAAKKNGIKIKEQDLRILKNAVVIECESKIFWVGKEDRIAEGIRMASEKFGRRKPMEYNLNAESVLPGFIDCHTHSIFSGSRQNEFEMRNQGATYQQIAKAGGGIKSTVQQTNQATQQELLAAAEQRAERFLKQGVTTIEIKSGYGLNEATEFKMLEVSNKIQAVRVIPTFLGPHAIPKNRTSSEYLNEIVKTTLPKLKKSGLACRVDMFVEKGYFNLKQAKQYYQAALDLGFVLTAHLDQLTRSGGVEYLVEMGAVSLDHLVQISKSDIKKIAKSNTTCVLLPTSDFYLKMKYPPARNLIDSGARVALATDFNPGTAPSQDISLLGVLARLEMKMTLPETIVSLTLNGAYALKIENEEGSIEANKNCNLVAFDCDWRDLFYSVGHHPVKQVIRMGMNHQV